MPDCYLLAVCVNSSLDSSTNNWSLFNLVEQVSAEQFPLNLTFETHVYWTFSPSEYETDFEGRLVLKCGTEETSSRPFGMRSSTPRFRQRIVGLPIPHAGNYALCVEYRRQGQEDWTRCGAFWPLQIEARPTGTAPSG
jgi:hypothetical protein